MALFSNLKPQAEPDDEMKEMTFIPAVFRHNPSGFQFQLVIGDFLLNTDTFKKYDKDSLDVSFNYYDEKRPDIILTVYVYPTLTHLAVAILEAGETETIDPEAALKFSDAKTLQQLADNEFEVAIEEVGIVHPDAKIQGTGKDEEPAPCTKFLGSGASFIFTHGNDLDKQEIESQLLIIPYCAGKWSLKFRISWEKGKHESDSVLDSFLDYFPFNFVETNGGDK